MHRWTLLLMLAPSVALADVPAGETISNAATVDITPGGFDAVTQLLPSFIPGTIDIDPIEDESEGALGQCWLGGYAYGLAGMSVDASISSASIVPMDGYLDLDIALVVSINDSSNPFSLYTELECIGDTCYGYVEPFNASIHTTIEMDIVENADGVRGLDATIGALELSYDLSGDHIHLDDCFIGTVEDVLNFFGLSMYDLILSLAGGFLDDAVADFGPEIETVLEDAFSSASISQEVELGDVIATLNLEPSSVEIIPAGMRLGMDGGMFVEESAECIAEFDPGYSAAIESDPPRIGSSPPEVGNFHAGIHLSDDFGNQALYSVWRGGLLCYDIDAETAGFPLDTSILGLMAGDAFDPLFPDSKPLLIHTSPEKPPTLEYAGENDVVVVVEDLGLQFYAELDHRETLMLGMGLNVDAGIDLPFDGTTGELAIGVQLAGEDVVATVTDNEFVPDANAAIEENFAGVFDTLVGSIVGGLVEDLAFSLPALEGLGLTALELAPAGDQLDWLGAYASIGTVPYEAAGCDDEGGCGGGCGGGCATNSVARGRTALFFLPLALVALRRRKED